MATLRLLASSMVLVRWRDGVGRGIRHHLKIISWVWLLTVAPSRMRVKVDKGLQTQMKGGPRSRAALVGWIYSLLPLLSSC